MEEGELSTCTRTRSIACKRRLKTARHAPVCRSDPMSQFGGRSGPKAGRWGEQLLLACMVTQMACAKRPSCLSCRASLVLWFS